MSETARHPDIFDGPAAVAYLGLDIAAGSPEGGLRVLHRIGRDGRIHPLRWAKAHLYHRADLDRFVEAELAAIESGSQTDQHDDVDDAELAGASSDPGRSRTLEDAA